MAAFPDSFHPLKQDLNRRVIEAARTSGLRIYLVGGYIRDALSGRYGPECRPHDFDYAVAGGSALAFARQLADSWQAHFVLLDQSLDTARVVLDSGETLDFAGCVGGSIESDLQRRDFTINALAWSPDKPEQVIDLVGGVRDLDRRLVRAVSESNFDDDPLRMMRAFRFGTIFGGIIDGRTLQAIGEKAPSLSLAAPERVSHELFAIMKSGQSSSALSQMGEIGLLEIIFPELTATRQVTPNAYHHLGLWDHSLEAVAQAERRAESLPQWAKDNLEEELSFGVNRLDAAKIACLLHDIGKPGTWQITPEGRHTFYGHDRLGAEMCEAVTERLKWSRPVSRSIVNLVRWHLRPGQLFHQGSPSERAIHRFYRTCGQDLPPLMLLAFGDLGATCGPGLSGESRDLLERSLIELLEGFPVYLESRQTMVRYLDGNEIMQLLGIKPGPILGEIMEALSEAQALHEVRDRAEAEKFVSAFYRGKFSS